MIIFCFLFLKFFFNFSSSNKRYYQKYEQGFNGNSIYYKLEPIHFFEERLKNEPIEICNEKETKHICYIIPKVHYSIIFGVNEDFLCLMENIVLDPSKFIETNFVYNVCVDKKIIPFLFYLKDFLILNAIIKNNIK